MATITQTSIDKYRPHPLNPNKGTIRGARNLEDSINYNGAGRSGLAAADGTILAGKQTLQAMEDAGIRDIVEVETDGTEWVVVKRKDLSPDDPRAKSLMIADNQAHEASYTPDHEALRELLADIARDDADCLMGTAFEPYEIQALANDPPPAINDPMAGSAYAEPLLEDFMAKKVYHSLSLHFVSLESLQHFAETIGELLSTEVRDVVYPFE